MGQSLCCLHMLHTAMFSPFKKGEVFKEHFDDGLYVCKKCGNPLFESGTKYSHDSPWPAFTSTVRPDSVVKVQEKPGALKVSCGQCGAGLGHEFLGDGPKGASRF